MKQPFFGRLAVLCATLLLAVVALGCGKKTVNVFGFTNERPTVDLTAAPISTADTAWYAYKLNWSGNDPDGRVVRFDYAIDPPVEIAGTTQDTLWVSTEKNEQQVFFRATHAYFDPKRGWRSNDKHTFVIRAVDNSGAFSAPKFRSFYSYTIAPVVFITNPLPNKFISRIVTPAVRINWAGRDEDGVFSQKPVKYKYKLFDPNETEYPFQTAITYPDSLRLFYAARNFAGWDSVSGDTTFVQYTGLTPNVPNLFVVIGIDEAGAYSPDFSLESNMLMFTPGFAGTLGPTFTVFNEFFFYQYNAGGYTTNELNEIKLEVPAGKVLTFNWVADPPPGAGIEWYRWKVDGDVTDETPRTNEDTDWYHWSRKSNLVQSCTIGPFGGGEQHFVYIAAQDNNNLQSLAIVHLYCIQPTFASQLLIVDDTRLPVDQFPNGINTTPQAYGDVWPAAAELDTFLYAKGGAPWKGPQGVNVTSGNLPLSKPGVFNGYSFDTLGTRLGFEIASAGVPLSLLGQYKHVLWLTDIKGLVTTQGPERPIDPTSYLRWMSAPGRANTLSTYLFAGGQVWFAGGTAASCTLDPYNAKGSRDNDHKFGVGHTVYSASAGELAPGRIMWDAAHWRSEMSVSKVITTPRKSPYAVGGWKSPGWRYADTLYAPDYSRLPSVLRRRSLALGDSLPPTCLGNQMRYYSTFAPFPVEYLDDDNRIVEDFDNSPLVENQRSALDTLYYLAGGTLTTLQTGRIPVSMTYYYGTESPRFVFSGFDLWTWSRQDCVGLVNFVLQEIWGMYPTNQPSAAPAMIRPADITGSPQPATVRRAEALKNVRSGSR